MTRHKDIGGRVRGAEMEGSQGNNHGSDGQGKKQTATTFPKTKLKRIMRRALQGHPEAKISGDACDAVDRCTLVFADLVTTVAVEECHKDSRSIVNGDDLINAMEILGFDHYVGPLDEYLRRYREFKDQLQPPCDMKDHLSEAPAAVTAMVMGEMQLQTPTPPQQFGVVLGQQPPCDDVTELGLHTDVYPVWSKAAEASTSSLMPPARAD